MPSNVKSFALPIEYTTYGSLNALQLVKAHCPSPFGMPPMARWSLHEYFAVWISCIRRAVSVGQLSTIEHATGRASPQQVRQVLALVLALLGLEPALLEP